MILGIIPARGGSKGIARKNIRPLCGEPLIAWTIKAAQAARLLDRFVVSTEDDEIARIARQYGADVIERPIELATDDADTLDVLQHVLSQISAETLVLLQPTCPIRNESLVDSCIQRFSEKNADSLATGFICKYTEYGKNDLRRQDIPGFFYDDGNVYVMKADLVRAGDRYGTRIERMLIDREQNIDIDEEFDFWLAEQVMLKRRGRVGGRHLRLIQLVFAIEVVITGLGARESGDDGFYLAAAHFVAKGLKPFIDFSFSQGPLLPYLYAPLVYLFGPTLLISRIAGIVLSLLLYWVALGLVVSWAVERDDENHRNDPVVSKLVFTYICVLYPEVWALLSKIGSKEALASLCCLMSVAGLFLSRRMNWNLLVSAFFVAVSFGIKYTSLALLLPLVLYVAGYVSIRHALTYCFLVGLFTSFIFMPYLLTAHSDSVINNFRAVKESLSYQESWIERTSHVLEVSLLTLGKYQLLLLPAIAFMVQDFRRLSFGAFLEKKNNLLIILFVYALLCMYLVVSPSEHRIFMYLPLLLVGSSIAVERCFYFIKDHFQDWSRSGPGPRIIVALLLLIILGMNSGSLVAFGQGLGSLSFSPVRWYLEPGLSAALVRVDKLCEERSRTLLYVGYLHHHILPTKCELSPLSSMSAHYLRLSTFSRAEAERYGFLSSDLFVHLVSEKRFDLIVMDNSLLEEYRNVIDMEYSNQLMTKYMTVFIRK